MNIEEARKVLWLKSNPRPIGELFDGGYITRDRLEWATKWAYNPKLQQAAKVLLESGKPDEKKIQNLDIPTRPRTNPIPVGMSLSKARSTPWPLPPYKGQPMGPLVESKQLSLKDLGFAVENAWDERVRQAATVLSLLRLEQVVKEPAPSAGFVHSISGGRSYSERKQSWLTFLDGSVMGLVAALFILLIIYLVKSLSVPYPEVKNFTVSFSSPFGIIGFIVAACVIVLAGLFISSIPENISKRLNKQIEEYRRGQEGEDRVAELIVQALDGNWHLFRNIELSRRYGGDLDLVLVGPPGIWVLEVKNFRGKYRNIGQAWEYLQSKKWKTVSKNPSSQALKNSYRLKNFLKADGLNVFVNAAVVWANEGSPLFVENPLVAVWTYSRLADELGNIWQGEKVTELERKKITDKLSKLCERAEKEHQLNWEGQRNTE